MHEFDVQRRTLVEQFRAKHAAAAVVAVPSSQPSGAGLFMGTGSNADQHSP